jgi:hypothetical protein
MARTIPGWERMKPSKGESGKPGWRLLSHDGEAQQIAVYRKNEGPWKDASVYGEWRKRDRRWRFSCSTLMTYRMGRSTTSTSSPRSTRSTIISSSATWRPSSNAQAERGCAVAQPGSLVRAFPFPPI